MALNYKKNKESKETNGTITKYFLWISTQKVSKTENKSLSFNIKHKNDKTKETWKKFRSSKLEHVFMLQFPLDETLGYRSKISLGILSQTSNVFQIIITPP